MVSLLLTTLHSIWESSHVQRNKHYSEFRTEPDIKMDLKYFDDSTELTIVSSLLEAILFLVRCHPNIFIFFLLVTTSAYFGLFFGKVQKVSRTDTVSPVVSSNLTPELKPSNLCASPMTCASSSDCMSLSSFSFSSVFDHLIDNGNFERYFKIYSSSSQDMNNRTIIAEHKLDGQKYLILVKDFDSSNDKVENLVNFEVNKYKSIKCRGVARYVTCWVEEGFGVISLYVQMEKIEGQNLEKIIKEGVDAKLVAKIMRKLARVLKFAHDHELVHGGLNLENIFIDQFGKVVVGQFKFVGSIQDDLIMFEKIRKDLLLHVHREESELAKRLVDEDRFVRKLDIYQLN